MKYPRDYVDWRKRAAKQFHCDKTAIDRAVDDGATKLLAADRAGNPITRLFYSSPAYVGAFQFWLYTQNPTLNALLTYVPNSKSPYSQKIPKKIPNKIKAKPELMENKWRK
jgi:hypothetical protein